MASHCNLIVGIFIWLLWYFVLFSGWYRGYRLRRKSKKVSYCMKRFRSTLSFHFHHSADLNLNFSFVWYFLMWCSVYRVCFQLVTYIWRRPRLKAVGQYVHFDFLTVCSLMMNIENKSELFPNQLIWDRLQNTVACIFLMIYFLMGMLNYKGPFTQHRF